LTIMPFGISRGRQVFTIIEIYSSQHVTYNTTVCKLLCVQYNIEP